MHCIFITWFDWQFQHILTSPNIMLYWLSQIHFYPSVIQYNFMGIFPVFRIFCVEFKGCCWPFRALHKYRPDLSRIHSGAVRTFPWRKHTHMYVYKKKHLYEIRGVHLKDIIKKVFFSPIRAYTHAGISYRPSFNKILNPQVI